MCARIAVDIDSTLYDFCGLACRVMGELAEVRGDGRLRNAAYSTSWPEWRTPIDLAGEDAWNEVVDICHEPRTILAQTPYIGAVEALTELDKRGHEIVYASNRDPSTRGATSKWLGMNGFPGLDYNVLCHTDDKLASIRGCAYLVDDRPKTLVGFVHDPEWRHQEAALWDEADNERDDFLVRRAFGLVTPYNRGLTDVSHIYLAPSWPLLSAYFREKIPSVP